MRLTTPPESQQDLLQRCWQLAGKTLGQIATELGIPVPDNLLHHKGWAGQVLEHYLGADAGNQAEPDFTGLGIEMKTLPLNANGQPKESTYVCTVSLREKGNLRWEDSWVRQKLAQVLWVPIEADKNIRLADRYVGLGWIWQPTPAQETILKRDWEELMDRVVLGEQADISAREGQYLQIRPKAANSRVMVKSLTEEGASTLINPKGFYLRSTFTRELLATQFK
ncbi:DNA mismatch repair endonuclease MutH [Methylophaga sp. OBS4]|uniref:DNA mismatch repair endonuclease MutH n=1 Tax=Methylophaga sp. OBS4 TaxID=2991935 RepID=UPI00224CC589|nr:DNA mismatch repair endonuclease MutH [Methylophaga sp. OBS4]MCX4187326.1 DNA mismatch repair endonuclease MutH [Methylophaga sp. OBS4]